MAKLFSRRIIFALWLTFVGLWAERIMRAAWPLLSTLVLGIGVLLLAAPDLWPLVVLKLAGGFGFSAGFTGYGIFSGDLQRRPSARRVRVWIRTYRTAPWRRCAIFRLSVKVIRPRRRCGGRIWRKCALLPPRHRLLGRSWTWHRGIRLPFDISRFWCLSLAGFSALCRRCAQGWGMPQCRLRQARNGRSGCNRLPIPAAR